VVLFRGYLPCDILFVGEAPGESEDAIGVPFVGEAGHRLNAMIFAAYANTPLQEGNCMEMSSSGVIGNSRGRLTYAATNVVSCIPREVSDTSLGDIRTPTKTEAAACQERLLEAVRLANPKRIVALGDIARRFCSPKLINTANLARWDGQIHTMLHPARILHLQDENPRDAMLLEKKFVIALSTVIRSL